MSNIKDLPTPITREEMFMKAIIDGDTSNLPYPITREEEYLDCLARNLQTGTITEEQKNNINKVPEIEAQLTPNCKNYRSFRKRTK